MFINITQIFLEKTKNDVCSVQFNARLKAVLFQLRIRASDGKKTHTEKNITTFLLK